MSKNKVKTFSRDIVKQAVKDSFKKFNPKFLIKNPVIFVVEIGFFLTLLLTIEPNIFGKTEQESIRLYNGLICFILFITVVLQTLQSLLQREEGKHRQTLLKKQDSIQKQIF